MVKKAKYLSFCVYRRSYLIWPPCNTTPVNPICTFHRRYSGQPPLLHTRYSLFDEDRLPKCVLLYPGRLFVGTLRGPTQPSLGGTDGGVDNSMRDNYLLCQHRTTHLTRSPHPSGKNSREAVAAFLSKPCLKGGAPNENGLFAEGNSTNQLIEKMVHIHSCVVGDEIRI